jgi:hypothetical protein
MSNQHRSQEIVLFLKMNLTLHEAADQISQVALPTYKYQLRDGLNIGGGTYIQFAKGDLAIVLVCNDEVHADVFVPSRKEFPYYCFVQRGPPEPLDAMRMSLVSSGIECQLGERAW